MKTGLPEIAMEQCLPSTVLTILRLRRGVRGSLFFEIAKRSSGLVAVDLVTIFGSGWRFTYSREQWPASLVRGICPVI